MPRRHQHTEERAECRHRKGSATQRSHINQNPDPPEPTVQRSGDRPSIAPLYRWPLFRDPLFSLVPVLNESLMPSETKISSKSEILVVGGGPAGSTVAYRLAELGHEVVLLEKDRHPRFHIGESLLPLNVPLFEQLGVLDEVAGIGMPKWGVDFTSPAHQRTVAFAFSDAWDRGQPYSFQVRRSELDDILLKNAARKGVTVVEGCRVVEVDLTDDGGASILAKDDAGREQRWHA